MKSKRLLVTGIIYLTSAIFSSSSDFAGNLRGSTQYSFNSSEILSRFNLSYENLNGKYSLESFLGNESFEFPETNSSRELTEIERIIMEEHSRLEVSPYISPSFIRSVIFIESSDDPNAIGSSGERGYMQIMKSTWNDMRDNDFYGNSFDPTENIRTGIMYFNWIDRVLESRHYNWNSLSDSEKVDYLVSSYNAGINRVTNNGWDLSKMPLITRNYMKKVRHLQKSFDLDKKLIKK